MLRTEGQIKQKLKQVMFRHLQKLLRAKLFRKRPDTCLHNRPSVEGGVKVWECARQSPEVYRRVCDSRFGNCLLFAKTCPCWEHKGSKKEVQEKFRALMESKDMGAIASEYPDTAALLWVLGEDAPDVVQEVVDDVGKLSEAELWEESPNV